MEHWTERSKADVLLDGKGIPSEGKLMRGLDFTLRGEVVISWSGAKIDLSSSSELTGVLKSDELKLIAVLNWLGLNGWSNLKASVGRPIQDHIWELNGGHQEASAGPVWERLWDLESKGQRGPRECQERAKKWQRMAWKWPGKGSGKGQGKARKWPGDGQGNGQVMAREWSKKGQEGKGSQRPGNGQILDG